MGPLDGPPLLCLSSSPPDREGTHQGLTPEHQLYFEHLFWPQQTWFEELLLLSRGCYIPLQPALGLFLHSPLRHQNVAKLSLTKGWAHASCPLPLVLKYTLSLKDLGLTPSSLKVHLATVSAFHNFDDSLSVSPPIVLLSSFLRALPICAFQDHTLYLSGPCPWCCLS